MTIIFGRIVGSDHLSMKRSLDDVWLALNMLPHLRWRWERKDQQGMHPIISKLAEKVFKVNLRDKHREEMPGVLLPEVQMVDYEQLEERPPSVFLGRERDKPGRWSVSSSPVRAIAPSPGLRLFQHNSEASSINGMPPSSLPKQSPRHSLTSLLSADSGSTMSPPGTNGVGLLHRPLTTPASEAGWPNISAGLFYPYNEENPLNAAPPGQQPKPTTVMQMPPPPLPSQTPGGGFSTAQYPTVPVPYGPSRSAFMNEENDNPPVAGAELDTVQPIMNRVCHPHHLLSLFH
jgi:hypothetical protein